MWRQILISNLIDTTELKPKGKLFHTFRNVIPKPGLNSLTNFQQHCLKRGKHYWEPYPIKKNVLAIGLPSSQTYICISANSLIQ